MSHFTCAVFGDNVEELMAPYDETKVVFEQVPLKVIAENIFKQNPERASRYLDSPHMKDKDLLRFLRAMTKDKNPVAIVHPDQTSEAHFMEFLDGGIDTVVAFDERGVMHCVHRRNHDRRRWDWYEIGGRWAGSLVAKPGVWFIPAVEAAYFLEKKARWPKMYEDYEPVYPNGTDSLMKKEIDVARMEELSVAKYMPDFDKYSQFREGYLTYDDIANRVDEDIKKGLIVIPPMPPTENGVSSFERITKELRDPPITRWSIIREMYWGQPSLVKAKEAGLSDWATDDVIRSYFLRPRDEYEAIVRAQAFAPYAFIKDGKWVSRGEMGWFGISSGDKETLEWSKQFREAFDSLPDNTKVTIVDCHT